MLTDVLLKNLVLIHSHSSMNMIISFTVFFIKTIPQEVLNGCTFRKKTQVV